VLGVVEDQTGYKGQKQLFKVAGREGRRIKEEAKAAREKALASSPEDINAAYQAAEEAQGRLDAWVATKIHRAIGDIDVKDLDKEAAKIRECRGVFIITC
jgi:hypothetical protein